MIRSEDHCLSAIHQNACQSTSVFFARLRFFASEGAFDFAGNIIQWQIDFHLNAAEHPRENFPGYSRHQ
jgi:hypothetical protein